MIIQIKNKVNDSSDQYISLQKAESSHFGFSSDAHLLYAYYLPGTMYDTRLQDGYDE